MLQQLPHLLPNSATVGTDYHIQCFGHVINLAVKAFLSLFDSSAKALKADLASDESQQDVDSNEESEEDIPGEDEEFEEDEADERDSGDWAEIAELSKSLAEVAELDTDDKVAGRTTMKKV